mmetsp:Transcript_12089/g.22410  ORF Transcript_12089/g.22410 Transcript_12089/m.22410 type:complete len:395 (+) Transcript_12089:213-1397(+)
MLSSVPRAGAVLRGPGAARALSAKAGGDAVATDGGVSRTSMYASYNPIKRMEYPSGVVSGSGLRHSRTGRNVAVFGATGHIGGMVVSELGRNGNNIVAATRGDDMSWRHLKTCADYGKLVGAYFSLDDEESVRKAIQGTDVVVNAMGKHYETKGFGNVINSSFKDVHTTGAELVARIAREEGCKHLVHVSSAQASKDSKSRIAQTKAEGDERVLEQFPGAVIVKPNLVYGEDDRYLVAMGAISEAAPFFPLLENGKAKQRPVYVGDVGVAITAIAENYNTAGNTYSLAGSHEYTTKEMIEYVMERTHNEKEFIDIPVNAAEFASKLINMLPNPYINPDQLRLMLEDAPGPGPNDKTFADLGIKPKVFETMAFNFVQRFRVGGHFVDSKAEIVHG